MWPLLTCGCGGPAAEVPMYCCTEPEKRDDLQLELDPQGERFLEVRGRPATALRAHTFQVDVVYEGRKLGVQLDSCDLHRGLMVKAVLEDGLLADWNRAHPDMPVIPYDKIFEVNGEAGSAEVLEGRIAASGRDLCLTVRRPQVREMLLQRTGSLGVTLLYKLLGPNYAAAEGAPSSVPD
ncbi:ML5 [Symbiodinium natans]|uniref:ML5 protein n=1 Tax=Symbiodinium natans TaxID=878477 RepID=A0A812IDV6_9DINO|nr:ML5 [Symbiodinium natans]